MRSQRILKNTHFTLEMARSACSVRHPLKYFLGFLCGQFVSSRKHSKNLRQLGAHMPRFIFPSEKDCTGNRLIRRLLATSVQRAAASVQRAN